MRRRWDPSAAFAALLPAAIAVLFSIALTVGLAALQARFSLVAASGVGLSLRGSEAHWTLPELVPGRSVRLAGAQQLTVVSDEPWELIVTSRVVAGGEKTPMGSSILVGVSREGMGTLIGPGGEPDWVRVSLDEARIVQRGGPTGPQGEAIRVDVEVHPSWDDPPGTAIVTQVTTTLAAGDNALFAYVHPSEVLAGYREPLSFWFFAPTGGGKRALEPGELVRLDVWKDDVDLVAQLTAPAGEGPWHVVVWHSLPESGLEAGVYRFRIVREGEGTLLASGVFYVQAQGEAVQPLALGTARAVATDGVRPESSLVSFPEVKLVVAGDPPRPGEPVVWSLTVINPERVTLMELRAEICLSPGWRIVDSDVPRVSGWASSVASAGWDRSCEVLLLGTLQGNRQKRVRFNVVAWEGDLARLREARSDMVIRVTGALEPGGDRGLLAERRLPLSVAEDPLLLPPVEISGRVFLDLNGSGAYEEGEPLVAGASVLVDGRRLAQTNRRGEFRFEMGHYPSLMWAESHRGTSLPRSISAEELWIAHGRVDLPLVPPDESAAVGQDSDRDGKARGTDGSSSGYLALLGHLDAGSDRQSAQTTLRAGVAHPDATFSLDLTGGAAREPGRGAGETLLDDLRFEAAARSEGVDVAFQLQRGLEREVKLGLLRPSKPAEAAYRLKVDLKPERRDAGASIPPGEIAGPYRDLPGRLQLGMEWGYAAGDLWTCSLQEASAAYVAPGNRIALISTRGRHTRVERTGLKEGEPQELRLEVDGGVVLSGRRWPYSLELSGGRPRELSPSCGFSPFDGWRWHAVAAPPVGNALQAVWWSGMVWPMTAGEAGSKGQGSAHELGITWRPLTIGAERVDISTAIQWERAEGRPAGPARLAARLGSRLAGVHDVRLEAGALVLASTDNPDHLSRGDRRLAVSWRVTRGQVRPWAKYEIMAPYGEVDQAYELGVTLNRSFSWPAPGETAPLQLNTGLRLSRAVDLKEIKDKLRIDLRRGTALTRVEWSGTATGDGSAAFWRANAYEKTDWRFLIEGDTADGRWEWGLEVDGKVNRDDGELEAIFVVGGNWSFGRWQAGWGRGAVHEKGAWQEYTTSVLRAAASKGPWTGRAEVQRKVGVHDTALQHAAYHISIRRHITGPWAVAASSSWTVTTGGRKDLRYGIGLERGLSPGEQGPVLRVGLVWDVQDGLSPGGAAENGAGAQAVSWTELPAGAGALTGVLTGASARHQGPRLEVSLALPYLW